MKRQRQLLVAAGGAATRVATGLIAWALVAIIAACSPSPSLPPSAAPISSATPDASSDASPSASAGGTTVVRAYFYLDGPMGSAGLVPVAREIPEQLTVGTAALEALLAGPTNDETAAGVASAVPAGSRLLGLAIADGVATVDLSTEFDSGGGSTSIFVRLGQVIYTLTQFPTVQAVRFQIDGRLVTVFSSEGLIIDSPLGRSDNDDVLPAIFVDRPAFGATLGNPARISGSANVFEAAFLITILDGNGARLAEVPAMATCGTGCRGTFDVTIAYSVTEAGWGTLRAWDASARDGSPENVRDYPVWLTPAE